MIHIYFACVFLFVDTVFSGHVGTHIKTNDRPIIGELQSCAWQFEINILSVSLLCESCPGVLAQDEFNPQPHRNSYIAASYVKFLESAGARVVPLMWVYWRKRGFVDYEYDWFIIMSTCSRNPRLCSQRLTSVLPNIWKQNAMWNIELMDNFLILMWQNRLKQSHVVKSL